MAGNLEDDPFSGGASWILFDFTSLKLAGWILADWRYYSCLMDQQLNGEIDWVLETSFIFVG